MGRRGRPAGGAEGGREGRGPPPGGAGLPRTDPSGGGARTFLVRTFWRKVRLALGMGGLFRATTLCGGWDTTEACPGLGLRSEQLNLTLSLGGGLARSW